MMSAVREIVRYRALLLNLVTRDIKVRYRRSVLGMMWTMLNPLLMMAVFSIVFASVFQFGMAHFTIYFLPAYLLWSFVSQTTSWSTACLLGHAALIRKIYVPKAIFVVATVASGLVNLLISLAPLALIMVLVRHPVHVTVLFVPVPILLTALFALGLSLLLAGVSIEFNDVVQIYQALLLAWMYLTPIVYPIEAIPERFRWLILANPMTHFVEAFRAPIYAGVLPSMHTLLLCTAWSVGVCVVGWWVFDRRSDRIAYLV